MASSDYDPFDIALGRKLKAQRALHGMRLREVGGLVHLSESALSAYELGKRTPGTPVLRRLAGVYSVEVAELLPTADEVESVQSAQVVSAL